MKIRRRKLLGFLGLGTLLAASGVVASWKHTRETDIVIAILQRRLNALQITQENYEQFAREYIETRRDYAKQMKVLSMASGIFSIITPYQLLPMGHPWRRLENNIVSMFLLSTDFFQNGADTQRPITYLGLYDPYRRPCVQFFEKPDAVEYRA